MTESLYARQPSPDQLYDVIVCGGGPAGLGAALAAAQTGARTLLLEARSQFGGTATAALWMEINFLFKDNDETSRGGVHDMLVERIRRWGTDASIPGVRRPDRPGSGGNLDVHPEYLKKILFDLVTEYEVDYLLYAPVVGVETEASDSPGGRRRVTAVTVGAKQGTVTFRGRQVVDSTGDGDVAAAAGCEMAASGDEETGWRPPMTVAWAVCNVDLERFYGWLESGMELDRHQFSNMNDLLCEYRRKGRDLPNWMGFNRSTVPGVVSINSGTSLARQLDASRSETLTLLEKLAIDQALEFIAFARETPIPGMEQVHLMRTGGFAMARDTRRLVGEYVFTDRDVMEGTEFPDAVASKYGGSDPVGEQRPYTAIRQGAQFPFRSLLPRETDGLVVAGRCSSATMLGHYGGKSMGNMISIGQAGGVAAALSAARGVQPRELDVGLIQERLGEMGVSL